jgi:hypothetical protein
MNVRLVENETLGPSPYSFQQLTGIPGQFVVGQKIAKEAGTHAACRPQAGQRLLRNRLRCAWPWARMCLTYRYERQAKPTAKA